GQNLPDPNITDDSGNNIKFEKHTAAAGTLKYAGPNPVYNPGGTSAEFIPEAGLYRLDKGEDDKLRLDGYQYTIEMWLYINDRGYTEDDAPDMWLVGKEDDNVSWAFVISDLADDDDLRWYHNDSDIDDDVLTERYDEWMHVAAVFDITDEQTSQRLYFNGDIVATGNNRGFNPADANAVGIGCRTADGATFDEDAFLDGRIDELRILDVALDVDDLLYPRATNPSPYDGEGNVDPNDSNEPEDPNVTLSWTPWVDADEHDIYFGTDYDSVRLATVGDDPNNVYVGRMVWRFLTAYLVTDPNLLLWYPYDEGTGDWVYDNSGHGLNASSGEVGDGWRLDGAFGGCLEFDDNIGFDLETRTLEGLGNGITIAVWLDGYRDGEQNWVINAGGGSHFVEVIVPDGDDDYVYWRAGNDTNDSLVWVDATPEDWEGDWHHFAFVKDENAGTMKIYFDADVARSKDGAISSLSNVVGKPFSVGAELGNDSDYVGRMDDLRVYDHALSDKEIASLFRGGDIELAWGPSPYDGQADAPYDSDLIWKPGDYAADTNGHDVYFGTDWDEVNDANILIHPNVDYNRVDANAYELGLLTLGKYYYWRVDEVNDSCDASPWKGKVWRFRVADYIIIDDMEDYTPGFGGAYPITGFGGGGYGWNCGYDATNKTNSVLDLVYPGSVYVGIDAHRSDQAMYYGYDNTSDQGNGFYSEISNSFSLDPNDWTIANVRMIVLWFRGTPGNDANESMYMGLEDESGAGSYAQVDYGDQDEDPNDVRVAEWQVWRVPLSDFTSDNPSLELDKMQTLYIGFGTRFGGTPGGVGDMYFDNIRLYQPICVPSKRPSEFAKLDFDEDCIIGFGDVEFMGAEWLESDINLGEVTNPSDTNLVGWWKLDDGDGNVATDSSS
ncbi:MAG: LamG domain-containing protein, partial [Planctomycetota bacterium]